MKKSSNFVKLPKTPNSELHGDLHVTSQVSPPKTPQKRQDMRVEEPEHDRTGAEIRNLGQNSKNDQNGKVLFRIVSNCVSCGFVWSGFLVEESRCDCNCRSRSRKRRDRPQQAMPHRLIVFEKQAMPIVRVCFRSCDQVCPCKNLQNTMAQQSRRINHI